MSLSPKLPLTQVIIPLAQFHSSREANPVQQPLKEVSLLPIPPEISSTLSPRREVTPFITGIFVSRPVSDFGERIARSIGERPEARILTHLLFRGQTRAEDKAITAFLKMQGLDINNDAVKADSAELKKAGIDLDRLTASSKSRGMNDGFDL